MKIFEPQRECQPIIAVEMAGTGHSLQVAPKSVMRVWFHRFAAQRHERFASTHGDERDYEAVATADLAANINAVATTQCGQSIEGSGR